MINIFVINEFFVSKRKKERRGRENIRELSFHVIYFSTLKIAFFQYMHNTGGTGSIESVATLICVQCPVENISV